MKQKKSKSKEKNQNNKTFGNELTAKHIEGTPFRGVQAENERWYPVIGSSQASPRGCKTFEELERRIKKIPWDELSTMMMVMIINNNKMEEYRKQLKVPKKTRKNKNKGQ